MSSRLLVALRVAATPEHAFDAFTREISSWWVPNGLFHFTRGRSGQLAFETRLGGRLTETYDDGEVFEIGRITIWEPPVHLAFTWRQASFSPEQETLVKVRFEAVGAETRVAVEHIGWDGIPREHVARHRFPLDVFQQRHAEWWRALLESLRRTA
ncbi:MAG TPA: SRPBCC domain-containing protein [Gammaproteobacteria bacterium]|nr:SRPBCC domain-containing protein [Gammaproteobacteria bacterium]